MDWQNFRLTIWVLALSVCLGITGVTTGRAAAAEPKPPQPAAPAAGNKATGPGSPAAQRANGDCLCLVPWENSYVCRWCKCPGDNRCLQEGQKPAGGGSNQ